MARTLAHEKNLFPPEHVQSLHCQAACVIMPTACLALGMEEFCFQWTPRGYTITEEYSE